jgi:F-type H+-transporting ATPase subunit alpha
MPVQEQVVSLYAGTNGYLDPIPVEDVPRYERELLEWMRSRHGGLLDGIKTSGNIEDMDAFEAALKGFADQFQASDGGAAAEPAPAEVIAADAALADETADTAGEAS